MIKFGPFAPDLPDYASGGADVVKNVVPRTDNSYGPVGALTAYSGALTARCQGTLFVRDTDGSSYGFAGDASKLYKLSAGSTSWADVKKVGGYTTGTDERWSFALYGRTVIATNYTDAAQAYVMGTSALFDDLSSGAPKARYVCVNDLFVILANTVDGTYGTKPQRVWWSAIDNPGSWPTPATAAALQVQSDYRDLPGEGGQIQGMVSGLSACDVAVFQEHAVFRGLRVGAPAVYDFKQVENARGCVAPGSIARLGPVAFYLADDGFYAFDGASSTPIGRDKIDAWVWGQINQSYLYRVTSTVDPQRKLVLWAFPGAQSSGGTPNLMVVFNYGNGEWSYIEQDVEILCQSSSFGYTLEQLDSFGTLETLPYSLDSRAWVGSGRALLSGFTTAHKLGLFSGSNMEATLETAEAQPAPNARAVVCGVRPIVDVASSSVTMGTRGLLSDVVTWGTTVAMDATGRAPQRAEGRFHRARVTIPAGADWLHAQGVEFEAVARGYR